MNSRHLIENYNRKIKFFIYKFFNFHNEDRGNILRTSLSWVQKLLVANFIL
jgi:hypothetical protein